IIENLKEVVGISLDGEDSAIIDTLVGHLKTTLLPALLKDVKEKVLAPMIESLKGVFKNHKELKLWDAIEATIKETVVLGVKNAINLLIAEGKKLITVNSDFESTLADKLTDVAVKSLQSIFNNIVDIKKLKNTILNASLPKVADALKEYILKVGSDLIGEVTNKALDKISSLGKLKVQLPEKDGAHTFFTYAIAGAGAFNVGVAGSAALAVIKGKTSAYIVGLDDAVDDTFDITVTGNTVVHSDSVHRIDTIASASVGSNNGPDQNNDEMGDFDSEGEPPTNKNTNVKFKDRSLESRDLFITALSVVEVTVDDGGDDLVITAKITDNDYQYNTKKPAENAAITGYKSPKGAEPVIELTDNGRTLKITFKKADFDFNNILQVLIKIDANQFKIELENDGQIQNAEKAFPAGTDVTKIKFQTELSVTEKINKKDRVTYTLFVPKGYVVDDDVKDSLGSIAGSVLKFTDSDGNTVSPKTSGEVDKMG
ncbi:MAG: hypothetical protein HUJ75_03935, partial [Parasporobacterium sp.]|nr:hypothetical protein [Parasporobacterium sp.]